MTNEQLQKVADGKAAEMGMQAELASEPNYFAEHLTDPDVIERAIAESNEKQRELASEMKDSQGDDFK